MGRLGVAAVVFALMLSATPLATGAGTGGGTVANKTPTVESFARTPTGGVNSGTLITFSGTLKDQNKEADFDNNHIKLTSTGVAVGPLEHQITATERAATTEPSGSNDGFGVDDFKIWDGSGSTSDGILNFKFRYTHMTAGTYTWRVNVKDEAAYPASQYASGVADLSVVVTAKIIFDDRPVDGTGTFLSSTRWGAWTAIPGEANVESTNYFLVENTGVNAAQEFMLDFTVPAGCASACFKGANGDSIPLANKIQYRYYLDATPGVTQAELDGGWTSFVTSATGAATFTFASGATKIYIQYNLLDLPAILSEQAYEASYTATATN